MQIAKAAALLAIFTAAAAARAQGTDSRPKEIVCDFDADVEAQVVEYWHLDSRHADALACDSDGDCSLSGWLFNSRTKKAANKPAILFLHGSAGTTPEDPQVSNNYVCTLANYFIPKGYVVYMPYMRGYRDVSIFGTGAGGSNPHKNPGFRNTGTSYVDYGNEHAGEGGHSATWWYLAYMAYHEELDIQNSITHLLEEKYKGEPLVDSGKIAIAGHSFGGARAVLTANANFTPQQAVVLDFSGAAMSWDSDWASYMEYTAGQRAMPMYLHMTPQENPDHSVSPVIDTFAAANQAGGAGEAVAMIYSRFEIPSWFQNSCDKAGIQDYWCAHSWFISSTVESKRWLPHVEDFLVRHGVKP